MEGTYQVTYQSPFDSGKALLSISEKDGLLHGRLTVHEKEYILTNGMKDQNRFSFTGKLTVIGIDISYMIRGMINDNILNAKVHTALGVISATGKKIE